MNSFTHDSINYETSTPPEILNLLHCGICLEVSKNPVWGCNAQQHLFCGRCIIPWKHTCPTCRGISPENSHERKVAPLVERIILEIPVSCPNFCGTSGSLKDMKQHQNKSCPSKTYWCDLWCGQRLPGDDFEKHKQQECNLRQVKCTDCGINYRHVADMIHRLEECPATLTKNGKSDTNPDDQGLIEFIRKNLTAPLPIPKIPFTSGIFKALKKRLFATDLRPEQLNGQLALLKDLNASIDGIIPVRSFNKVKLIDLSTYKDNPEFTSEKKSMLDFSKPAGNLVVLTDTYDSAEDCLLLKGATYIGNRTPIVINSNSCAKNGERIPDQQRPDNSASDEIKTNRSVSAKLFPNIPEAVIRPSDEESPRTDHWTFGDIDAKENNLGTAPSVTLMDSSLVGVRIVCINTQGILATGKSSTHVIISHCEIVHTHPHGITLFNTEKYTVENNTLSPALQVNKTDIGTVKHLTAADGV